MMPSSREEQVMAEFLLIGLALQRCCSPSECWFGGSICLCSRRSMLLSDICSLVSARWRFWEAGTCCDATSRCKLLSGLLFMFVCNDYEEHRHLLSDLKTDSAPHFKYPILVRGMSISMSCQAEMLPSDEQNLLGCRLSMAGLYYLPFQAGISLFFRFSGQSIPNR